MPSIKDLTVKIFADGAVKSEMMDMYDNPYIKGFTTNPSLMRKAGINDYELFATNLIKMIPDRPISFEVVSDVYDTMYRQAFVMSSWGENVFVKIPVMNTRGENSYCLIKELSQSGIKVNVTAVMTLEQVIKVARAVEGGVSSYISVFAGRIADTGVDPLPLISAALDIVRPVKTTELVWASTREVLNIFQADAIGCHIITVPPNILKKLPLVGKDLEKYSLETVQGFFNDALNTGLRIRTREG